MLDDRDRGKQEGLTWWGIGLEVADSGLHVGCEDRRELRRLGQVGGVRGGTDAVTDKVASLCQFME